MQERLLKKLGDGAYAFRLGVPAGAPGSVTLQPGLEDEGEPCGVHYYVKLFVGDSEIDRSHRRYTLLPLHSINSRFDRSNSVEITTADSLYSYNGGVPIFLVC